jgi:hypothetical protein
MGILLTPFNKHSVPEPLYFQSNDPKLKGRKMLSHGCLPHKKGGMKVRFSSISEKIEKGWESIER